MSGEGADALATFEHERRRLHALAYRMTGSVADADDICQEAWLRWDAADRRDIAEPAAYLTTIVTRLALDRLGSAARRRETYVGPYLPEPVVDASPRPTEEAAELADSLTFSFLVLLDELAAEDRAALLLHDVFGYSFGEAAAAMGSTPAAVRQRASRARRRLAEGHHRPERTATTISRRLDGLLEAVAGGDVAGVMAVMAPDVVMLTDGGANRRAARHPVRGADAVTRFIVNLMQRGSDYSLGVATVNGLPGLVLFDGDELDSVVGLELDTEGLVAQIFVQRNPDKLAHVSLDRPR